jgi:hypothetical protein
VQRCPQPTRRPFETRMHQAVRRAAMMLPVTVGVAHAVRPSVTIGDENGKKYGGLCAAVTTGRAAGMGTIQ